MSHSPSFDQYDEYRAEGQKRKIVRDLLDRMEKLRSEPSEILKRRWIWELLQNAHDTASQDKPILVRGVWNTDGVFAVSIQNGSPGVVG